MFMEPMGASCRDTEVAMLEQESWGTCGPCVALLGHSRAGPLKDLSFLGARPVPTHLGSRAQEPCHASQNDMKLSDETIATGEQSLFLLHGIFPAQLEAQLPARNDHPCRGALGMSSWHQAGRP